MKIVWRRGNTKQETDVPAESSGTPPTPLFVGFVKTEMVGGIFEEIYGIEHI